MTVQQELSESRNPGRRYQECTRNAPGILVGRYQECTRNPDIEPGIYQQSTRNPGMGPELPGILQEYVGQWKVLLCFYRRLSLACLATPQLQLLTLLQLLS